MVRAIKQVDYNGGQEVESFIIGLRKLIYQIISNSWEL